MAPSTRPQVGNPYCTCPRPANKSISRPFAFYLLTSGPGRGTNRLFCEGYDYERHTVACGRSSRGRLVGGRLAQIGGQQTGSCLQAGRPGVLSASLSKTDANGVAWTLDQAGGAIVSPDGPKAGPPILVKTDVQKVGDREMSVGLLLEGQAGERYRPVVKKNGTAISAPGLRIVSEAGQVIAQDSFQYG